MNMLPPFVFGSPLMSISEGTTVPIDSARLSSPFREPVWIDEVRLSYWQTIDGVTQVGLGGSLRLKLALGNHLMTSARESPFVPFWSFGPTLQTERFSANGMNSQFRWKLPKPLFVPPGMVVSATALRTTDGLGDVARFSIAYVGRYAEADRETKDVDVPFVGVYEYVGNATTGMSSETDLVNPFSVPLNVQRFICRVQGVSGESFFDIGNTDIKMTNSLGEVVVNNFANRLDAFDPFHGSITAPSVLGPRQRFNVQLQSIAAGSVPMVSMIGWRKERIR